MGKSETFNFSGDVTIVGSNVGGHHNTAYGAMEASPARELLDALARLRPELERRARTPEEQDDVATVQAAEQAARTGDVGRAMALLRSTGDSVLRVAEQIGSGLAVEILTRGG